MRQLIWIDHRGAGPSTVGRDEDYSATTSGTSSEYHPIRGVCHYRVFRLVSDIGFPNLIIQHRQRSTSALDLIILFSLSPCETGRS